MYVKFRNKETISFRFLEQKNFEDYSCNLVFLLVLQCRVSLRIKNDCGMHRNSAFVVKDCLVELIKAETKSSIAYWYFSSQEYQYIDAL